MASASESEPSGRDIFPLLGASAYGFAEAALFFLLPLGGDLLSSSSHIVLQSSAWPTTDVANFIKISKVHTCAYVVLGPLHLHYFSSVQ